MRWFSTLYLVAVCLAIPLFADIEGTVEGTVFGSGRLIENAKVVVEVDSRWGYEKDDDLEQFREWNKGLPDVSGSAETTTDKDGKYSVKLTAKVSDNEKLPETNFRVGRALVAKLYVIVKVTAIVEGYRLCVFTARLPKDGNAENPRTNGMQSYLVALRTVEAQLVLQNGAPAPGLRLIGVSANSLTSGEPFEVSSDDSGHLAIPDSLLADILYLRVLDDGLAFPEDSPAWRINLKAGTNDLGKMTVVPGGSLKLRTLHAETLDPVGVRFSVQSTKRGSKLRIDGKTTDNGLLEVKGLPVGDIDLSLVPTRVYQKRYLWPAGFDAVAIKAGETADLGDVALEPEHTLEVIAVDENGKSIETYQVNMSLVPGTSAAFLKSQSGSYPISAWANCTAEKCTVANLVRGTWRVTVTVAGYSPGTAEIEIPSESALTVRLEQGGAIQVKTATGERRGWDRIWAVSTSAPSYATLATTAVADVEKAFDNGLDYTLVFPPPTTKRDIFAPNDGKLGPLPADTYTLFIKFEGSDQYRVDNVVVRKGQTTDVALDRNASAEIQLAVTESASPKGSVTLFAVSTEDRDRSKSVSVKTVSSDRALLKGLLPGTYQVMTKQEFDWLNNQRTRFGQPAGLELLGVRNRFTVWPGDRFGFAIELFDPGRIWLTVKVKLPSGFKMETASIIDLYYSEMVLSEQTVVGVNGTFDFGPVRAGTYEFRDGSYGGDLRLYTRFDVNTAPEQTVDIDLSLRTLTVSIKAPAEFKDERFSTYLRPYWEEPSACLASAFIGNSKRLVSGKVEISDVPDGRYLLTSWAEKFDNGFSDIISTTELIEVTRNKSFTLKFDRKVGELNLRLGDSGDRLDPYRLQGYGPTLWGELRDSKGKNALVRGVPVFNVTPNASISGIPAGTYELRLFGRGFETQTFSKVEIVENRPTSLEVSLVPTAQVRLQISNLKPDALLCQEVTYEALDEKGNALPIDAGGFKTVFQPKSIAFRANERNRNREDQPEKACELHFMNVPIQCVRMRVKVAGFKTVEFAVRPDIKRAYEHTLEFERE